MTKRPEMSTRRAGTREHRIIPGGKIGGSTGTRHTIGEMNWQELSKHALRFVALLVAAAVAYWLLRATGLYEFTARDREGLNTLILLIGNIYAVMFAFVIFVIWGQVGIPLTQPTTTCRFWSWKTIRELSKSLRSAFRRRRRVERT